MLSHYPLRRSWLNKAHHSARNHDTRVTPFGLAASTSIATTATIAARSIVSHTASRLTPNTRSAPNCRLSHRKNSSICQRFL